MRRLVYLSSARQDFQDILRYLARESGSRAMARGYVNRLQEQCRKLAALPGTLGQARPELRADLRSFPYQNYVIFFRVTEDVFEVVNLLEGHRDIIGFYQTDSARSQR